MSKPKLRKKNCNKLRLERIARASIGDLLVCALADEPCRLLDTKTGKFIRITETLVNALCQVAHKWTCLVAVHGRIDERGETYMKTEQVGQRVERLQSHMIDELTATLETLKAGANRNQIVNTGWIASPSGMDIINIGDLAYDIFNEMGAFERAMK